MGFVCSIFEMYDWNIWYLRTFRNLRTSISSFFWIIRLDFSRRILIHREQWYPKITFSMMTIRAKIRRWIIHTTLVISTENETREKERAKLVKMKTLAVFTTSAALLLFSCVMAKESSEDKLYWQQMRATQQQKHHRVRRMMTPYFPKLVKRCRTVSFGGIKKRFCVMVDVKHCAVYGRDRHTGIRC